MFFFNNIAIPLFISFCRILQNYCFNSFNYTNTNKYLIPINQSHLIREKTYFYEAIQIYNNILIIVFFIFPKMLYNNNSVIQCFLYTILSHIFISEPFYYFTHRILHTKTFYYNLHYFHHMSYNTIPSTGLVQHYIEHFMYVINFAPSVFIPYFIFNKQNWISICLYFLFHDFCNAIGHSNLSYYNFYYNSFIKYLFYSPEFHQLHHNTFISNYSLFMPIWDYIFNTYKEPILIKDTNVIDFVFIVHFCGISSIINSPQISIYNIYNKWSLFYNIYIDFLLASIVSKITGVIKYWSMPTYKILKNYRGKIVSLNKTPTSYLLPENKNNINNDILSLIKEHKDTSYFGLGNLNKNKSINNCGIDIVNSLKDTNIKILTGDTMTTSTLFHSIISYDVDNFFFIGGTGKIGKALTILLINRKRKKICLYSKSIERFNEIKNEIHIDLQENLTLTNNINDIINYSNIIIGKQIFEEINIIKQIKTPINIYDYNVPFFNMNQKNINHIQIGILENKNKDILDGYFDISYGLNQYQLYSCYAGCILGVIDKRKTNEVGEICLDEIDYYWELGKKYDFTLVKNI